MHRKLYDEDLHNMLSLPNIIRMIETRKMRGVGHVARMEVTRIRKFNRKILGTGTIWKI
jgi:hypothetical protein